MIIMVLSIFLCFFPILGCAINLADDLDALFRIENFQGAVLIQNQEGMIFSRGYGHANLEHQVLNHPYTVFRLASVTKEFTAVAMLSLGIPLDATISQFFPDYPQGDKITIHHLLTHTSGIPSITKMPKFSMIKKESTDFLHTLEYFKNLPLQFPPGSTMEYSDSGYLVLGAIIEKVSKMSYEAYLRKILFAPLGMHSTALDQGQVIAHKAAGYRQKNDQLLTAEFLDMSLPSSAGGLLSTVEDLARFDRYLTNLPQEQQQTLFKIYSQNTKFGYGYGFKVFDTSVGHTGSIDGFTALHLRYHVEGKSDYTIILLSNFEGAPLDALQKKIIHLLWR